MDVVLNKYLEKRVELLQEEDFIGIKSPMELEYYLVESNINDMEELLGRRVYGIEIVKKEIDGSVEMKTVKNFSCCRESTIAVLEKLADNTVTPVGLPFILDDLVGV